MIAGTFAHFVIDNIARWLAPPEIRVFKFQHVLYVFIASGPDVTRTNPMKPGDREIGRAGEDLDICRRDRITCISCSKKPREIGDRARLQPLFHLLPAVQQLLATCHIASTITSRCPSMAVKHPTPSRRARCEITKFGCLQAVYFGSRRQTSHDRI